MYYYKEYCAECGKVLEGNDLFYNSYCGNCYNNKANNVENEEDDDEEIQVFSIRSGTIEEIDF